MAAPMDLNVCFEESDSLKSKVKLAFELGYDVIAINYVVPELQSQTQKKKRKNQDQAQQQLLSPSQVKLSDETVANLNLKQGRRSLKQLARISTVITDTSNTHRLSTEQVQNFDVVAVQPVSEKTFHQACSNLDIDIITIDVSQRLPFHIKRPSIHKALERGIHFEIQYSPSIRDSTIRRYTICNALSLMSSCKGKNVILTSGCSKPIELRGPYDVANLGMLFGLTQAQGKDSVTSNCRAVIYHSESRRALKSTISVIKSSQIQSKDSWILKKCRLDKDKQASDEEIETDDIEQPRKKVKNEDT